MSKHYYYATIIIISVLQSELSALGFPSSASVFRHQKMLSVSLSPSAHLACAAALSCVQVPVPSRHSPSLLMEHVEVLDGKPWTSNQRVKHFALSIIDHSWLPDEYR